MEDKRAMKIINITQQMLDLHKVESDNFIDLKEVESNTTEHFQNMIIGFKTYFERLTSTNYDIVDFIHLLNKLSVQYLLENDGEAID